MNSTQQDYIDSVPRIIASCPDTPTRKYLFATDPSPAYVDFDETCERLVQQGYNTLYFLFNPYRSPEGAVACEEDLTPEEPDFDRALKVGPAERQRDEALFTRILASLRKHRLKVIHNAGVWTPQTWFRAHPESISRFPDQAPQYDSQSGIVHVMTSFFQKRECGTYTPSFRLIVALFS